MKIGKIILPAQSPKGFGDGEPLRFKAWANAPQRLYDDVWSPNPDTQAQAFQALLGTSEPQTVEIEDGDTVREVVLDFRTVEGAAATMRETLPDDLSRWISNLPAFARARRHQAIDTLLPNSFA